MASFVLIGIGLFFLLTENHIIESHDIWRLWPLILIAGGITRLQGHGPSSRMVGGLLLVMGVVFEAAEFGWLGLSMHNIWPLVLIGLGVLLLWRNMNVQPRRFGSSPVMTVGADEIDHVAVFGGGERRIGGDDFESASLLAVFGGYKIDLRKAAMKGTSAVVDANAIFGGIEILVPESWNVVVKGAGIFGGYGDETHHPGPGVPAPQLIVEGVAVFGGVAIKN